MKKKRIRYSRYDIPHVVLPKESGTYKVIQISINGIPYIRFGSVEEDHVNIWCRFNDEMFDIENKILDNKIIGGGFCKFDADSKSTEFYGHSQGYNKGIDEGNASLALMLQRNATIPHIFSDYKPSENLVGYCLL